jgi:hypothetical protein
MKTISGKTNFVALVIVAGIALVGWIAFAIASHREITTECPQPGPTFCLTIRGPGTDQFYPLTSIQLKNFNDALKPLSPNQYDITYLSSASGATPQPHYTPPPNLNEPSARIQTDKVIKFDLADSSAAGASAANDPNVTYRVSSSKAAEVTRVLDAFQ